MGYFSNGSEGMDYEARWCDRCVHQPEDADDGGCPVLLAHFLHNYDQCSNKDLASALSCLIPRSKDGLRNEECLMFIERTAPPTQAGAIPPTWQMEMFMRALGSVILVLLFAGAAHGQSLGDIARATPRAAAARVWTNADLPTYPKATTPPVSGLQAVMRAIDLAAERKVDEWRGPAVTIIPEPKPGDWGYPTVTVPERVDSYTVTTYLPWGPRTRSWTERRPRR